MLDAKSRHLLAKAMANVVQMDVYYHGHVRPNPMVYPRLRTLLGSKAAGRVGDAIAVKLWSTYWSRKRYLGTLAAKTAVFDAELAKLFRQQDISESSPC